MEILNYLDDMNKRISDGDVSIDELRTYYSFLRVNKDDVFDAIMIKINKSKHKNRRKDTKAKLCKETYDGLFDSIAYAIKSCFTYSMDIKGIDDLSGMEGSKHRALADLLKNATDEDIRVRAEQLRADRQERDERKERILQAIRNPQTLMDFKLKRDYGNGVHKEFSPEQQELYDYLYSLHLKKKRVEERIKDIEPVDIGMYTISSEVDTRDDSPLWVVRLNNRVDRDSFKSIDNTMGAMGGVYSRFKSGFIFKFDPTEKLSNGTIDEDPYKHLSNVEHLRVVADNMNSVIEEKRRERLENTGRKADLAASSRKQADYLEQIQNTMLNVANAIENGSVELIDKLRDRTQIETLERVLKLALYSYERNNKVEYSGGTEFIRYAEIPGKKIFLAQLYGIAKAVQGKDGFKLIANRFFKFIREQQAKAGYTDDLHSLYLEVPDNLLEDLRKVVKYSNTESLPYYMSDCVDERARLQRMGIESVEELRAYLREYYKYRTCEKEKSVEDIIRDKKRQLLNCKISGYFPTPPKVIEYLLDQLDIKAGMSVLEPSAGSGHIADSLREEFDDVTIDVCEVHSTLREILELKGYNIVAYDFLEYTGKTYDFIVMNPPFENSQDIEHVRHAFNLLKPGGTLISIMCEGPYFREDKKAQEFRTWVTENDGLVEKLPEGSFLDSERSTGVSTRILVLRKNDTSSSTLDVAV